MTLKLADQLALPLDVVTQTMAILAKRRAGKSYAMRRLVEQLVRASQQVVLVDPKGDQWGIRSSADGTGPGLPLVILGGERADVPLEVGAGEVVAKLVVEERVSAVLDLSMFRKYEVATFMTGFLESLYRLKARETYRTPMMLVIDEADAVAPQKPQKGEERMLGAAEDIVRRGGQRGIGCVLVSQRSAVLNKNVLTQAQILVVLRTIAPQDLVAMKAWIDVHGTEDEGADMMDSLPSLPVGDAWFWSPGWPTVNGIFKRVHVLPIETFDSGATPKPGEKRRDPKTVADVDLEALKRQMASTIEKAKADDPRELRKQLADVRRQFDAYVRDASQPKVVKEKGRDRFILKDGQLARLESLEGRVGDLSNRLFDLTQQFQQTWKDIKAAIDQTRQPIVPVRASYAPERTRPSPPRPRPAVPVTAPPNGSGHLPPAKQKILNALAWLGTIGQQHVERQVAAFIAGVSSKSSAYENNISALRTAGLLDYPGPNRLALTAAGAAIAHPPDAPLTPQDLHAQLARLLQPAQWRILQGAMKVYPEAVTREQLAALASEFGPPVSAASSAFENNVSRMRSLGLLDYPQQGHVVATSVLFLE